MSRADDLRMKIDELEEEIACAERDRIFDGDDNYDVDSALLRLEELRCELKWEESGD